MRFGFKYANMTYRTADKSTQYSAIVADATNKCYLYAVLD